jgi:hypothetical protein
VRQAEPLLVATYVVMASVFAQGDGGAFCILARVEAARLRPVR